MQTLDIRPRSYSWRGAIAAALALALFGTACREDDRPLGPTVAAAPARPPAVTPAPSPVAPVPPPPGPSQAVLAIIEFTARTPSTGRVSSLGARLVLAETGGRSAAYIATPYFVMPNGDQDFGCAGTHRIAAGGRWDLDSLGYCAPEGFGNSQTSSITVIVNFWDEQGRPGTLTRTVELTP